MTAPLQRPTGASYSPTHPQYRGLANWARSCGKCGKHTQSAEGQKRHPILGILCVACSGAKR